jgi:hypothetical protein
MIAFPPFPKTKIPPRRDLSPIGCSISLFEGIWKEAFSSRFHLLWNSFL